MNFTRLLPVLLSALLMAAHFSRADNPVLTLSSLLFPLILLVRRPWVARVTQTVLVLGGIEWIRALVAIAGRRQAAGEAWLRMAVILGAVAVFTFASALVFRSKNLKERYDLGAGAADERETGSRAGKMGEEDGKTKSIKEKKYG